MARPALVIDLVPLPPTPGMAGAEVRALGRGGMAQVARAMLPVSTPAEMRLVGAWSAVLGEFVPCELAVGFVEEPTIGAHGDVFESFPGRRAGA